MVKKLLNRNILKRAIAFVLFVTLFFTMYASAYFSVTTSVQVGSLTSLAGQSSSYVYTVSSEEGLRLIASDSIYNPVSKTSSASARKIIKLGANVSLTADLLITCDFNMDLNGFRLDLAGHTMTVKHAYYGDIAIYNGTIISSTAGGKLVFDTPNATHTIPNTVIDPSLVQYLAYDSDSLSQRIFDFVDNELMYGDSGNYYYSDIVLPNHYYTYDIKFEYTSSNPSVISNDGKIVDTSATAQVSFSLKLTIGDKTYVKTSPIVVWTVPLSNTTKWLSIAAELFDNSISRYARLSGSDMYYYIASDIRLLSGVTYPGITYSYTADRPESLNGNIVLTSTGNSTINLSVTPSIGGVSGTPFVRTFKVAAGIQYYQIVSDDMNYMFPDGKLTFYSLTDTRTIQPVTNFNGTISFAILDSNNYLLNGNVVSINTANPPTMLSQVYLEVTFAFNDQNSTIIKRTIRLDYNPTGGNNGSNDYFSDFYYYLSALLTQRTNNLDTYTSFIMPKSYNSAPKFNYRLVTTYADGTAYNGAAIVSVVDNGTSWGININTANVPMQDMQVTVYYEYTFDSSSQTYTEYTKTSSFSIPGIAHSGTDIPDANLYAAIKNAYCPNEPVLLASSLQASKALFEVHNNTITNFKGIDYLVNTAAFNFSGCAFAGSNFSYLNNLTSLTSLNISNNGLTDISTLPLLSSLNTLDISSNKIARFDRTEKLTGLTTLYVYGQSGVTKPANDTNSSSYATDYGNTGKYNGYTFIIDSMRGVNVYKADANTIYAPTADEKTAASVLRGIFYQSTNTTTTNSTQYIPSSVTKAVGSVTYTLGKTVLSEASSTNTSGLFSLNTSSNGTYVYRLFTVTYGTLLK